MQDTFVQNRVMTGSIHCHADVGGVGKVHFVDMYGFVLYHQRFLPIAGRRIMELFIEKVRIAADIGGAVL